ncbi:MULTISPECIES: ATP-binding protein [unclassified Fusibacter]|uniref:sensor histidine kinase n=1 Tax=unclassified Fusibacter TaxID=2624464 RepID=UPI0013E936A1|nr:MULTISPECIES: ATP-binding protein [unclassified Fusibacter]MCK8060891.1 cell wall metabolism sensor histidine kinase WalK [Fusibacter sp. A2]NPE23187.1 HAMP domain-containing protein [Fusibacter sp. A1]
MFKSIRWKFVTIFIMLVLIAIVISGVFIIEFFDQYNKEQNELRLDALSALMLPDLQLYSDLGASRDKINKLIENQEALGFREEIFVMQNTRIIATSSTNPDIRADQVGDPDLLISGMMGIEKKKIINLQDQSGTLRVMDKVYPIKTKDGISGLLYLRYNLEETDSTIKKAKMIILQSTVLALSITIVLGVIIAQSITGPINDVTEKAFKMARGDFDQYVEVKSDDEIGKLAEMFNHLTRKLKLSLNEISREKNKLEAIVNNMADGLIAVTKLREVLHINPRALDILRANDAKVTKDYDTLVDVLPEVLHFDVLINRHPEWNGNEVVELNGVTYRVRFEPFANEKGEKEGFILIFQDITEHQRLENMRRDFVANVSHELKTPLTSIKSYTETLMDGMVDDHETTQQFLSVINDEADRMGRLVRDLLQLSNYDSSRSSLEVEVNDWVTLVKTVINKMNVHVKSKSQQISLVSDKESIRAYFDYDRMEQVITNLISNAIKYTPESGKIKLMVIEESDNVVIKITDTGFGIGSEHLSQIFDRFYRVDKARSREQGGTGLGLAIAKEIVELHHGYIDIESEVGTGTTVKLRVPTGF